MQERLQKILAHAGIASRRHAEEIIQSGRVTVNGHLVTELGSKADPDEDVIKVDGKKLRRVRIGSLEDQKLPPGAWRFPTQEEVNQFRREFRK